MKEDFLQFIWQHQLFKTNSLETTDGERIEIISYGFRNTDAGPDFNNVKLKIGETLWAGSVEIHLNSSDWIKHKHFEDKSYNSVVLHVVNQFEFDVYNSNNSKIPSMVLEYDKDLYQKYMFLITNKGPIPCSDFIPKIDEFLIKNWQNRLIVERIEARTKDVEKIFYQNENSWEETFYIFLAKNFGFKINALPFQMLASSLPFKYIAKHKDNLFQIEALLFGQAGFFNQPIDDEYFNKLKDEYEYLSKKFQIKPIQNHLWKFLRLRPVNFPTIRIAQFAAVLYKNINLFSNILETDDFNKISNFFDVEVSEYWLSHFNFGKISNTVSKKIGKQSINGILINSVSVFLFAYGNFNNSEFYKEKSLDLLEKIPAEKNNIIQKWETTKLKFYNSLESQSMLQLYNEYCSKGKCLNCNIGGRIIIKEKFL